MLSLLVLIDSSLFSQLLEAEVERHPVRVYDVLGAPLPVDDAALRGQQLAAAQEDRDASAAASTPLPQSPVVSNNSPSSNGNRPAYQRRGSASSLSQQLV